MQEDSEIILAAKRTFYKEWMRTGETYDNALIKCINDQKEFIKAFNENVKMHEQFLKIFEQWQRTGNRP